MSIKVMSWVWDNAPEGGSSLLMLLAIADFADDEGVAYPSVPTLADKTRLSPKQTRRILHTLIADDAIAIIRQGGGRMSNKYLINRGERTPRADATPPNMSPLPSAGVQPALVQAESKHDPSYNHQEYIVDGFVGEVVSGGIASSLQGSLAPPVAATPPKQPTPHQANMVFLSHILLGHTQYKLWTTAQANLLGKTAKKIGEMGVEMGDVMAWYNGEWKSTWPGNTGQRPNYNQLMEAVGRLLERSKQPRYEMVPLENEDDNRQQQDDEPGGLFFNQPDPRWDWSATGKTTPDVDAEGFVPADGNPPFGQQDSLDTGRVGGDSWQSRLWQDGSGDADRT